MDRFASNQHQNDRRSILHISSNPFYQRKCFILWYLCVIIREGCMSQAAAPWQCTYLFIYYQASFLDREYAKKITKTGAADRRPRSWSCHRSVWISYGRKGEHGRRRRRIETWSGTEGGEEIRWRRRGMEWVKKWRGLDRLSTDWTALIFVASPLVRRHSLAETLFFTTSHVCFLLPSHCVRMRTDLFRARC